MNVGTSRILKSLLTSSMDSPNFSSNQRPNLLRIVVGQFDLKENDEEEKVFDVEEIAVHPHWE